MREWLKIHSLDILFGMFFSGAWAFYSTVYFQAVISRKANIGWYQVGAAVLLPLLSAGFLFFKRKFIKDFFNRFFSLENGLGLLRELYDNLGSKLADVSRLVKECWTSHASIYEYLVDEEYYLKIAEELLNHAKEFYCINTTPPFEWYRPLPPQPGILPREEDNPVVKYRHILEKRIGGLKIIKRITIVEEKDALCNVLVYAFKQYFSHYRPEEYRKVNNPRHIQVFCMWLKDVLRDFLPSSALNQQLENVVCQANNGDSLMTSWNNFLDSILTNDGKDFNEDFKKLSKTVSQKILESFDRDTHAGYVLKSSDSARTLKGGYVILESVNLSYRDEVKELYKEQGLFKIGENQWVLLNLHSGRHPVRLISVNLMGGKELPKESGFSKLLAIPNNKDYIFINGWLLKEWLREEGAG